MLKIAAAALIGLPLALLAALSCVFLATGVAIVDVREGGPGGQRIVVPVPLLLAQAALALAPAATQLDLTEHAGPELCARLGAARDVAEALGGAPDGELVRFEEPGESVLVEKRGDGLRIEVHDRQDDVVVQIPLAAVRDAVSPDGRLDAPAMIAALRQARLTRLVDVRSADDHVRVSIW